MTLTCTFDLSLFKMVISLKENRVYLNFGQGHAVVSSRIKFVKDVANTRLANKNLARQEHQKTTILMEFSE